MIRLEITSNKPGIYVTDAVLELVPDLKNYNLNKILKNGEIRLNGIKINKDYEIAYGDVIEIYAKIESSDIAPLDICYEDKNFIIVNKQPGVSIVNPERSKVPDLLTAIEIYMKENGEYSERGGYVPFPCFNMDKYTGGLVMFAKNGDMYETFKEAMAQRRIKRIFKAIIKGCPPEKNGTFQHFYTKNANKATQTVTQNSRNSIPVYTKYRVIRSDGRFSLVETEPVTGLEEQERVHMSAAGYPIIGDPVYGDNRLNKKLGIFHQALWATDIEFTTGVNNMLEYLNGKQVYTDDIVFPIVDY